MSLKLYIVFLLFSLIKQNSTETLHEYNDENKSFYYYKVGEVGIRRTPKILTENLIQPVHKNENEAVKEIANSLAILQYQPVVILMDDTCKSLSNAKYFTNNLFNHANIRNEFWLMKFNSSGVTSILAQSRINSAEFNQYIEKEIKKNTFELKGSATFFAILKAVEVLPKNSYILLLAENKPIDEDLAQLATLSLQHKQIQLFVIWSVPLSQGREEKLLQETCTYTNGTFYLGNYSNISASCKKVQKTTDKIIGGKVGPYFYMSSQEELLIKATIHNNKPVKFFIDSSVTNLDIVILGNFTRAILKSQLGHSANLLDLMSVETLSPGAISTHALGNWAHVRFNTVKVTNKPTAGIWEIQISGANREYELTVYAETDINVSSKLLIKEKTDNSRKQSTKNELQLDISGKVSYIQNIALIDKNGYEILSFPLNSIKNMKMQQEKNIRNFNLNLSNNNLTLPIESFYVKITGSTEQGEVFSRLSYVEQSKQTRNLRNIIIESSIQSNLIATPGSNPKVIFEVTNNYDTPMYVFFGARGEKRILQDINPKRALIPPKRSVEVTVYTIIPSTSTLQYTDTITLSAHGPVNAEKSVYLYVNNKNRMYETTLPYLNYKFTSSCMEVPYSSCHSAIWSIEVTAQDSESGLLRVISDPPGLYSPNGYISGTKDLVTLYYSSNCCQSVLDITAIDLNNNKRSYKADANNTTLSTSSIIAILLGVLILIIIIIILIVVIVKRYKQRNSIDLPRYRSQVATSRF